MIINLDSIPSIVRGDRRNNFNYRVIFQNWDKDAATYALEEDRIFYTSNYDVYLITIDNSHCLRDISLRSFIPENILKDIENGKTQLCIAISNDAYYSIVDIIYEEVIISQNFNEDNLIFLCGSPDMKEKIISTAINYGKKPIKTEWFSYFEKMSQRYFENDFGIHLSKKDPIIPKFKSSLENERFEKAFISLNRNWHPHRTAMLCLVNNENLLDRGFISFSDAGNITTEMRTVLDTYADPKLRSAILNGSSILNKIPLYIDTKNLSPDLSVFSRSLMSFYKKTYFSIVNETNFDDICPRFLTEKTFKTILVKHPFIMYSLPKSMILLKELGYKTFSEFIDEGYDLEENDSKRMLKVFDQLKRLCELSLDELHEFRKYALPIVEYNFDVLMSKRNFSKVLI